MCIQWRTCLCWRDSKSAVIAIGVFALVTSLMQILVQVAVFSGKSEEIWNLSGLIDSWMFLKLYIALAAADFFVVLFSIIMLVGLERTDCCRSPAIPWIIWIFLYILYESAINIYFFVTQWDNRSMFKLGYLIVPLVYWICKEIILVVGWCFVVSHQCYGDMMRVRNSDSNLHLVDAIPPSRTCSLGTRDPIYYNGGLAQVQIRDYPRSAVSHFDVVRPTSSCQVYSPNCGGYLGRDYSVYGPPRYM